MNYYLRHLGDYARDAGHLSMLEHGAYTALLDRYYITESPIPADQVYRLTRAISTSEKKAVDSVLAEFFTLKDGAWTNGRCDRELSKAQVKITAAQENGKRGGRPKRTEPEPDGNPPGSKTENPPGSDWVAQSKAHHSPLTNHQSPGINTHTTTRAGCVGLLLRRAGLQDANTGHPTLLALIDAGCTDAEFSGAATEAVKRGKGFAYAIGMLRRQREEVESTVLHFGQMPEVLTPGQAAAQARIAAVSPSLLARKPAPATTTTAEVIDVATRRLG